MKAAYCKYRLNFTFRAKTSREEMTYKDTYFIKIWDEEEPDVYGIGECALFKGLSSDDVPNYEDMLRDVCRNISTITLPDLQNFSSIKFGVETAFNDLCNGGIRTPFPSTWTEGKKSVEINGLIWMGNFDEMASRITEKLGAGYHCLKLKIGGIDFNQELELIKMIRSKFGADVLDIRLDANGAFTPHNALDRLESLYPYKIHSIEQPIKPNQWEDMERIVNLSPINIALDEELIGINDKELKRQMLTAIKPDYIILKPALCGGFSGAKEWIVMASDHTNSGWWVTSALESNIGLNAIAQWTAKTNPIFPQGLGTGMLYDNNIPSPIIQRRDRLMYNPEIQWQIPTLDWVTP